MRPYNVEIFDRQFNFKYSTLVDAENFEYREDVMDPVKNTISVPSNFSPEELAPSDQNAPRGWYLRIIGEEEYQGIITTFEVASDKCVITFSQMITALDLNIYVPTNEISAWTIEGYIAYLVRKELINSADTNQNIPGLTTVVTTSETYGTFQYSNSEDEYSDINLLDDLIYPAFELFGVVTDVKFNPQEHSISINVGKNSSSPKKIEADLPNIFDESFTIKKYSKEVNKVDCYDMYRNPPVRYTFYLHTNGTYDQNAAINRIIPVVNTIVQINGYPFAKALVDARINKELEDYCALNEYNGVLSTDQVNAMLVFINKYIAPYIANHPIPVPNIEGADSGKTWIGNTSIVEYWMPELHTQYQVSAKWVGTDLVPIYGSCWTHTLCNAGGQSTKTYGSGGEYEIHAYDIQKPIDRATAVAAINDFKKTTTYANEIESAYQTGLQPAMLSKAASIFAKNKYSNLIELSTLEDDPMINPLHMEMGRVVEIIHDGISYSSLLSGREVSGGVVKLIFGTIRLELTSYLKGRY